MLTLERTDAVGLLVVGDLHLSSRKPERRNDDYARSILDRLAACVALANQKRLLMVLLGDIYHFSVEPNEALKTELVEVLRQALWTPLSNVGNHDVVGQRLQRCDSLMNLKASGVLRVCTESGPFCALEMDGVRVGIGMTPHGQAIPLDVDAEFPNAFPPVDGVIWFTHHDLAFQGAYPKAILLREIAGCEMAFNGHMHRRTPDVQCGVTTWCNQGGLAATSVTEREQEAVAIAFFPTAALTGGESLVLHFMGNDADGFDLTGRMVTAAPVALDGLADVTRELVDQLMAEPARTDSGAILREEILSFMNGAVPPVRAAVLSLLARAAEAGET